MEITETKTLQEKKFFVWNFGRTNLLNGRSCHVFVCTIWNEVEDLIILYEITIIIELNAYAHTCKKQ